jgi:Cu2+-exporting ATPase
MRHVEDAKSNVSNAQVRANTSALWLFYCALFAAIATGVFWIFATQGSLGFVVERVSSVLLVAAPATMVISIPMVALWSSSTAARAGLLVRKNLDAATKVQVLALGKAGVLTTGRFTVESISVSQGATADSTDELLSLAAAAETKSQHAIAVAVGEAARLKNLSLSPATNVQSISGVGVVAQIDGRQVAVGGPAMLNRLNTQVSYDDLLRASEANENGLTVIFVVVDDVLCGQIQLADQIRDSAADAVQELKARGIEVCLVTGDATGVASFVANQVGIERFYAEVHPDRKPGIVKQLQVDGIRVAFVGDSIEDASALAQADVGIAFGAGSDVSIESAGLVLINADPMSIPRAFTLAKRGLSKRRQNLTWTLGFSVVTLALAAGALAPIGLLVSPVASVVLVSLSTVIVAVNGQLLRR